ncbi:MAG: hypothetical protein AAF511_07275, partial [Pseudomonadota bacterium]
AKALGLQAAELLQQRLLAADWHTEYWEFSGRYDRTAARLFVDGSDVGALLVARGFAKPWSEDKARPDWCIASGQR